MSTDADMTDRSEEYRETLRQSLGWVTALPEKQDAFLRRMVGYHYRDGPLLQAWEWFSQGYDDCLGVPQLGQTALKGTQTERDGGTEG